MVKIKRGDHETTVSNGSYETIFKPLGYTLVEEKKVETHKVVMPKVETPKETKVKVEETKTTETKKKKKQEEK